MSTEAILHWLEAAQSDSAFLAWREDLLRFGTKPGKPVNLVGPGLSHKAYLLAALHRSLGGEASWMLVLPDELQLRRWEASLQPLIPGIRSFRPRELDLTGSEASSREAEHERLAVLADLCLGRSVQLLVSAPALLQRLPSVEVLKRRLVTVDPDKPVDPLRLEESLLALGYEKTAAAEVPGQFARRGDILDIVPLRPASEQAAEDAGLEAEGLSTAVKHGLRLSFFDDEIDSLTRYDCETQRSLGPHRAPFTLLPVREWLLPVEEDKRTLLAETMTELGNRELLEMRRNNASKQAVQRLEEGLRKDVESLRLGLSRTPQDRWVSARLQLKLTGTLTDFWLAGEQARAQSATAASSADTRSGVADGSSLLPVFFDEPARLQQSLDASQALWEQRVTEGLLQGRNFTCARAAQIGRADCLKQLTQSHSLASLASIGLSGNGLAGGTTHSLLSRESESYRGRETFLLEKLRAAAKTRRDTKTEHENRHTALGTKPVHFYLCAQAEDRIAKLRSWLELHEIPPRIVTILPLGFPHGFEYPGAGLHVIGVEELFASPSRRKPKRKKGVVLDLFSDLRPGDRVVHDIHGIAIYEGIENIESGGVRRDYLKLSYARGDTLFLPMEALDQIQKYVGASEKNPPKLSRLGGNEWTKLQNRARESIRALATDLVKLYATRLHRKGHAFGPETTWERELADSFPYEETDDQLRCIEEIKADMESERVMDRLLCGDVGFGKTEVAFRALFKAVIGGYQAVLLAPTTVLAQQHYENLLERLGEFPVRVGLLSRFAPEALQKKTLTGLQRGTIDIAIGTHRLLSKDVKFHKLGLVIIDEEQRFGVDHKEQLKALHPTVDVLTLSATPIPRTLHMSLSGIRDISVIEEAPVDRRAVQTYVMEFDLPLICDAIQRELSRGGQVFYLFNNTHQIAAKATELEEAMPGVRVLVAHGKMPERHLEQVITDFLAGEADVLVCTTIIESGIDMPNVNTLIVENADRLGLAQLYQLRGRVGRSGRQAYAYITYRRDKVLNEEAEQRLIAIRDFTELGAGMKIALRDLEVRGAGNLLGGEQHGQMEAVGYDLYYRMLDEELQNAKEEAMRQDSASALAERQADSARAHNRFKGLSETREATHGPLRQKADTVVELPVDAYVTRRFIPDEGQRMDMYRRLTSISSSADYFDVLDELTDRYGELPEEVQVLADISYIRHFASRLSIKRIHLQGPKLLLHFAEDAPLPMEALSVLLTLPEYRKTLTFDAGAKPLLVFLPGTTQPREIAVKLRKLFLAAEQAWSRTDENKVG